MVLNGSGGRVNKPEETGVEKNVTVHVAVEGGIELASRRQKHLANDGKSVGVCVSNRGAEKAETLGDAPNRRRVGKDDGFEAKGVLEECQ